MPQQPTLIVMAAGMGSRYNGLKQIDPISPNGEVILDFSVYDALRAGFKKIVLIIKREMEADFEAVIGNRLRRAANIQYAYQDSDDLPDGFRVPDGRIKPWGTAHAVRAARKLIQEPFAVINADDFYGADAFRVMHRFLTTPQDPDSIPQFAMVGYRLDNTLTDNGSVTRGVCRVENGALAEIRERTCIEKREDGVAFTEDGGVTWNHLAPETTVSMQFFGFTPDFLSLNEKHFTAFLQNLKDPMLSECYLPLIVEGIIENQEAAVQVLHSQDRWFGVTYTADKPHVTESIAALRREGKYPADLWTVCV